MTTHESDIFGEIRSYTESGDWAQAFALAAGDDVLTEYCLAKWDGKQSLADLIAEGRGLEGVYSYPIPRLSVRLQWPDMSEEYLANLHGAERAREVEAEVNGFAQKWSKEIGLEIDRQILNDIMGAMETERSEHGEE